MSMAIRALPATTTPAEARRAEPSQNTDQLAATMSKTSAATATQLARATSRECRTILGLFIVSAWSALQELANCLRQDEDRYVGHGRDVNASSDASDEVSMAREQQQHQRQHSKHSASSSPAKSMRCTRAKAASASTGTAAATATLGAAAAEGATSGHQLGGQPLMALLIGLLLLNFRLAAGK